MKINDKLNKSIGSRIVVLAFVTFVAVIAVQAACYKADQNNGYCGPNGSVGGTTPNTACTITTCSVLWGCQSGNQYLNCWTNASTASCTTTLGLVEYVFYPFGWYCSGLAPGPDVGPYPCSIQYTVACTPGS